jgi:CrcB protein
MHKLLYIAIGGGTGAVLRYLISGWGQRALGNTSFPTGTLLVNLLGSLAIGVLAAFFAAPQAVREEVRLLLLVGLLGGFTTFSTFAFETFSLADDGERGRALANLLLSNALCLVAVWLGYRVAQRFYGS